jgi:tyrosine-protein phosphatase YwqE
MELPFLTRPRPAAGAPGRLGLDFHNHLLPGVDDGMETVEQMRAAIAGLRASGFGGAVMTPHIYREVYDNTAAGLRESFAAVRGRLGEELRAFPLFLAAEYFADEHFLQLIQRDELLYLPVAGERWVLVEFPYFQESPYCGICLAVLAARGYRPVVAHVERYRYVAAAPALWLDRFARAGAILQGNIGSLAGQYGARARRFAGWLQGRGLLSLWGSDLHKVSQIEGYVTPGLRHLPGRLNAALGALVVPAFAMADSDAG